MTAITRNRSAFQLMGFDTDDANALCLVELWVRRGLIGGPNDGQATVLEGRRTWTVIPAGAWGGYLVLRDGEPVNWFPSHERALNDARDRNRAELLRAERRLGKEGAPS